MRILIAEDDRVSRHLLQSVLAKWGYEVAVTCDGNEAWQMLQQEDRPRLAILDWMMPGMDGVQICRELRAQGREPYVYVLLLTAKTQKQDLIDGMDSGADDYITKPFDSHELKVRLRAGQRIVELQSELVAAREALRFQTMHDALTGLYSRAAILTLMEQELERGKRNCQPAGAIMVDVDHFKRINDTHGHTVGDKALAEVAARIRKTCRVYDLVGRYGGDEILIMTPEADPSTTSQIADRMCREVSNHPLITGNLSLRLTASFGVADVDPTQPETLGALIDRSDKAVYAAKARGGNCTCTAQPQRAPDSAKIR